MGILDLQCLSQAILSNTPTSALLIVCLDMFSLTYCAYQPEIFTLLHKTKKSKMTDTIILGVNTIPCVRTDRIKFIYEFLYFDDYCLISGSIQIYIMPMYIHHTFVSFVTSIIDLNNDNRSIFSIMIIFVDYCSTLTI